MTVESCGTRAQSYAQGHPICQEVLEKRSIVQYLICVVDDKQGFLILRTFIDGKLLAPRVWFTNKSGRSKNTDPRPENVGKELVRFNDLINSDELHFKKTAIVIYEM